MKHTTAVPCVFELEYALQQGDVSLAMYERKLSNTITNKAKQFVKAKANIRLTPRDIDTIILDGANPASDEAIFWNDVKALATLVPNARFIRLITGAKNRFVHRQADCWHTDSNSRLLLCTYMGAGTRWVEHEDAISAGESFYILKDGATINQVPTGAVALLKGTSASKFSPVHAAPEGNGKDRLLLVIGT